MEILEGYPVSTEADFETTGAETEFCCGTCQLEIPHPRLPPVVTDIAPGTANIWQGDAGDRPLITVFGAVADSENWR